MMNTKILVTGGAGYIGSHMLLELKEKGYEPIVFDNLSNGCKEAAGDTQLVVGDLLSLDQLDSLFSQHRFKGVIHFAALTKVEESVLNPADFYLHNVQGTFNLLESMRRHSVSNLIFSSTAAVYGEHLQSKVSEESSLNPKNPYGTTKWMCERIIQDYQNAYGLNATILRYFNAAGCDPEGRVGIYQKNQTLLIPVAVQAALGIRPSFTLFGTDYETKDGTCVRDFIHVKDLCSAHLVALKALLDGRRGSFYNLGQGSGTTVKEVLDCVQAQSKNLFEIHLGKRRPGDIAALVADISKAKKELGWEPKRSEVKDLVRDTLNWYSN